MQVLNARTARTDDGKTRCYAAPAFVRLGGAWRAIDAVLSVTRDRGAYRVQVGADWIRFAPRMRPAGQLKRAVLTKRRFGDVIDASAKPDAAEYDVTFSRGVERIAAGWRFTSVTDADLGVFLTDWLTRFGPQRVSIADDRATLDLTDVEPDRLNEINLDPETVLAPALLGLYAHHLGEYTIPDAWSGARNAAGTAQFSTTGRIEALTYIGYFETCEMRRSLLSFDTAAIPADGKACRLHCEETEVFAIPDDFAVAHIDPPVDDSDPYAAWQAVNDAVAAGSGGACLNTGGAAWASADLIAAGDYAQAADYQLAVLNLHDHANAPMTTHDRKGRIFDDAAAYLEFTDAPVATPRPGRPLIAGGRGVLGGPTP